MYKGPIASPDSSFMISKKYNFDVIDWNVS